MTKIETQEILDRARTLDGYYEDTLDAIRFWKREAYLAKSASPYVKRSQLDGILDRIEKLEKKEKEIVDVIAELREKSGLSWGDFLEALAEEGDR